MSSVPMWNKFKIDHIGRVMRWKIKEMQRFLTLTKMRVHYIEYLAIIYNIQHFWSLYRMTGYSIEWPINHIDRNIYTDVSVIWRQWYECCLISFFL